MIDYSIALVTNSFYDTPKQLYCNDMKMEHIQNFMR